MSRASTLCGFRRAELQAKDARSERRALTHRRTDESKDLRAGELACDGRWL